MSILGADTRKSPLSFADPKANPLQTREITTCKPLFARQNRPSAGAILAWLEGHAVGLVIQPIRPGRRPKNRCVLQFRDASGEVCAVGGASIAGAVWRARIRLEAAQAVQRSVTCRT